MLRGHKIALGFLLATAIWSVVIMLGSDASTRHLVYVSFSHLDSVINTTTITTFATVAIAFFTLTLWRSTDKLWLSSSDAAQRQLRAYISFNRIQHTAASGWLMPQGTPGRWILIAPFFENSGVTPAINVRAFATYKHVPSSDIDTFEFDSFPPSEQNTGVSIGPRINQSLATYNLPLEDCLSILNGAISHFILIRIIYNDVIQSNIERHTQIAFRIQVHADPTPYFDRGEPLKDAVLSFAMLPRFFSYS